MPIKNVATSFANAFAGVLTYHIAASAITKVNDYRKTRKFEKQTLKDIATTTK